MKRVVAIIPARMGSSRFPGKPLAAILGRPMIEHVVCRAALCDRLDAVYVATCDEEIRVAVESIGGAVILTSSAHERASDRAAEAALRLEDDGADIVVMIQGDEPMITPDMISASIEPFFEDPSVVCVNLARRIVSREEHLDPNTVKVVSNLHGDALYFSRAPIPAIDFTGDDRPPVFKQVCVIPFRYDFLRRYSLLPPTPLERAESIDMLRVLEHGGSVRLVETETRTRAVDTPEDLRLVETLMQADRLVSQYRQPEKMAAKTREGA